MERALAGEHFVENRAKAEDVGARIESHAADLLGRHVACGAHHDARFGALGHRRQRSMGGGFGLRQFGEAEVENLDAAIFGDEKIFRLQVAVDDAFFVGRGQSVRDLQA